MLTAFHQEVRALPIKRFAADDLGPDLPTQRQETARAWIEACNEADALAVIVERATPRWYRPVARVRHLRAQRAALYRLGTLKDDSRRLASRLERLGVGAAPRSWGVLSTGTLTLGRLYSLEQTLGKLSSSEPAVAALRDTMLQTLPSVRALTELHLDPLAVAKIENALLNLECAPELSKEDRRALREHLPASLRPHPTNVSELERVHAPVTLFVSEDELWEFEESEPGIRLHDIITNAGLRGHGLGSETLAEVCRYADHRGLPIVGEIIATYPATDADFQRLARWYARAGFVQSARDPGEWERGGLIRRDPRASAQTPRTDHDT